MNNNYKSVPVTVKSIKKYGNLFLQMLLFFLISTTNSVIFLSYTSSSISSHHKCPGHIAAQSPGSQQETLCVHHLLKVQGRNQPPSHQLQVQVHWGLCEPAHIQWRHSVTVLYRNKSDNMRLGKAKKKQNKNNPFASKQSSGVFFLLPFGVHTFTEVNHTGSHGPLRVLLPTNTFRARCENQNIHRMK